ncbi:MAG: ABC transporter [Acidithiobacillales bacterium SM23_46]|nr:MAG: ABC transporter [Thiotrichales bacterium SG8_50]KPK72107.1 MAG: ABC transporter [Acidithiobacillales bacterium SM23_46]KPL27558.1 MAG: ABC transporter [Acidithiobacillales bacterium SM1_46]
MITTLRYLAGAALAAALASAPAQGADLTGTLKKIKETGTITIGHRDASIPFSYLDDRQQAIGYALELCMRVVEAVKTELKMPGLKMVLNPVTSATRIPLMANGTIDLECGSTTNNLEREKQVSFTITHFVTATRLLAKKSSNIKSLADMKGKTIVSTAGTTNHKLVTQLNNERNLGMNVLAAKDHAEAFLMVESGRAVAFAMDDILLYGLAASSKNPQNYAITSEALSVEPYGIMLRRDDPAFQKLVDNAMTKTYKNGDINKIYDKWFLHPIPPKGVNLNLPMSEQFKKVIEHPTRSGDPKDYM